APDLRYQETKKLLWIPRKAAMEAVWIRKFVGDLGVMPSINKPINMYCDNSAAITFANEPGVMKGARLEIQFCCNHIRQ
ncbi:hypothetical protein Tco_1543545, partial [Tanacetum coccineum]